MKKESYVSPEMETVEMAESLQGVFCQSPGNGQSEKYNPNGDTSGWF